MADGWMSVMSDTNAVLGFAGSVAVLAPVAVMWTRSRVEKAYANFEVGLQGYKNGLWQLKQERDTLRATIPNPEVFAQDMAAAKDDADRADVAEDYLRPLRAPLVMAFTALAQRDREAGDAASLHKARVAAWGAAGAHRAYGEPTQMLVEIERSLEGAD